MGDYPCNTEGHVYFREKIMQKISREQLSIRQALPLELKELYSARRIKEWYEHWNGQVYVAFSGGKDSTVLLDMVRKLHPEVPAVFVDTGLEYKEILEFVSTVENVMILKPDMTFREVIKKYGWPVISKQVSMGLHRYRRTTSYLQKNLRLNGGINPTSGKKQTRSVPIKWHFLKDAPFKCSEQCCEVMKKRPFRKYNRASGRVAYIGTMAEESDMRRKDYLKTGCNAFELGCPLSKPMAFWKEEDVWAHIKKYNLSYSEIYDKGETRTGCKYCIFGAHLEAEPNRFQRMKERSPGQYNFFINTLGGGEVLDYIGIKK